MRTPLAIVLGLTLAGTALAAWRVDSYKYDQGRQLTVLQMSYEGYGIDAEVRNFPYTRGVDEATRAFLAKLRDRESRQEVRSAGAEKHGPFTYYKYFSTEGRNYGNIVVIYALADNDVTIVHFRVAIEQEMQLDWKEFSSFVGKNWNSVARAFEQQTMQNFERQAAPAAKPPVAQAK